MNVTGWHEIASVAFERMVYSLAEGTLLTFVVALALRLLPARTSQTRFAIWFSALFGIVAVTLFGLHGASGIHSYSAPKLALLTLPVSFALGAFALWALLATIGVLRIGLGIMAIGQNAATVRTGEAGKLAGAGPGTDSVISRHSSRESASGFRFTHAKGSWIFHSGNHCSSMAPE